MVFEIGGCIKLRFSVGFRRAKFLVENLNMYLCLLRK